MVFALLLLLQNPRLKAEFLRMAGGEGTRTSQASTEQPDDDAEAIEHAQDNGLFLADGFTPDAARARRALNRMDARAERVARQMVQPLAANVLNSRGDANLNQIMQMTDDDGTPLATPQSIREVASQLPPHLLADPKVLDLVINSAIGLDRRQKRTPKAQEEPLYLASAGGRGSRAPAVDSELRDMAKRAGLSETALNKSAEKHGWKGVR